MLKRYLKWINNGVKRLVWYDISLIKLATMVFALLLAKQFPVLLDLNWYWYVIVFVIAGAIPGYKLFKK